LMRHYHTHVHASHTNLYNTVLSLWQCIFSSSL